MFASVLFNYLSFARKQLSQNTFDVSPVVNKVSNFGQHYFKDTWSHTRDESEVVHRVSWENFLYVFLNSWNFSLWQGFYCAGHHKARP